MRRATAADVGSVNDWIWRDSGCRPDFSGLLSNQLNVCLIEGEGGALFVWRGPGVFEVHVFFAQRGKEVIRLSREMLDLMRRDHGAQMFWAAVPTEEASRRVVMFTRLMGWKSQGTVELPEGRREIFSLES